MRAEVPEPVKVEPGELTPTPEITPSEHSDWADMHSSTELAIRDEFMFDVGGGIVMLGEKYDFDYYVGASVHVRRVREMQEGLDWFERFEADNNGVDESSDGKYSLESLIGAMARTMLKDGYTHGLKAAESKENIRVEYAEDSNKYVVQVLWKHA